MSASNKSVYKGKHLSIKIASKNRRKESGCKRSKSRRYRPRSCSNCGRQLSVKPESKRKRRAKSVRWNFSLKG